MSSTMPRLHIALPIAGSGLTLSEFAIRQYFLAITGTRLFAVKLSSAFINAIHYNMLLFSKLGVFA
jgi:hypothetical protein